MKTFNTGNETWETKFKLKVNVKIKVALDKRIWFYHVTHLQYLPRIALFFGLLALRTMVIVDIHLSANEFTPFHLLFYYIPSEAYKSKFVSTFPRDSFPISITKDIKHYAGTILYFVIKNCSRALIPIQHFLQNYLPWPIIWKSGMELWERNRIVWMRRINPICTMHPIHLLLAQECIILTFTLVWWFLSDVDLSQKCNLLY